MGAIMDQGHVYSFFGQNRKRIKILVYDGSGLVLIAKRIERGKFLSHQELLGKSELS
jgi:transposase